MCTVTHWQCVIHFISKWLTRNDSGSTAWNTLKDIRTEQHRCLITSCPNTQNNIISCVPFCQILPKNEYVFSKCVSTKLFLKHVEKPYCLQNKWRKCICLGWMSHHEILHVFTYITFWSFQRVWRYIRQSMSSSRDEAFWTSGVTTCTCEITLSYTKKSYDLIQYSSTCNVFCIIQCC